LQLLGAARRRFEQTAAEPAKIAAAAALAEDDA
jgi:hypothetical protein